MKNLDFTEYPKSCARDDFWGQVKRTVNGKPVPQEQIDMIVEAVRIGLELDREDWILDLCCGNGALSRLFFAHCRGGVGVDFSSTLISVAKEYFERPSKEIYFEDDVVHYVETAASQPYTKAVCYGAFQYLPQEYALRLLNGLRCRFSDVMSLYFGNLPDKALLDKFYREKEYVPGIENDHTSMIGIWRTREEFFELAATCGWNAVFHTMPTTFYAAHYRYDAVLTPSR